jgi:hypothetical protein
MEGRRNKFYLSTPTLTLPHQGGGKEIVFVYEY